VHQPQKALPRGILLGLLIILVTSLVMGFGIAGTQSLSTWQALITSEAACAGSCPQLAVGKAMLGDAGYTLMALATVTATWGTLVVSYSTMPRILYSIARDGGFFGVLSKPFSKLHPEYGTPVMATLFTLFLYGVPALRSGEVVKWVYSAAYVWAILYVVYHLLALFNRRLKPETSQAFPGSWFQPMAVAGIVLTILSIYYAFTGSHVEFGGRALLVIVVALGSAVFSFAISPQSRT
jgi:APA family basic amino acid/polyamine antiporter